MVVDYLNIKSVVVTPHETDAPLVVHPNAVLPFPVATQALQSVSWIGATRYQVRWLLMDRTRTIRLQTRPNILTLQQSRIIPFLNSKCGGISGGLTHGHGGDVDAGGAGSDCGGGVAAAGDDEVRDLLRQERDRHFDGVYAERSRGATTWPPFPSTSLGAGSKTPLPPALKLRCAGRMTKLLSSGRFTTRNSRAARRRYRPRARQIPPT